MKKRHLLLFLIAFIPLFLSAQDESKSIELNADDTEEVEAEFNICKLLVRLARTSDDEKYSLSVDVENTNDYYVMLFGHAYTEKDLKKLRPSIRFDRTSYGGTSKNLMLCEGCRNDEIVQIEPSYKRTLVFEEVVDNGSVEVPIYIAKYKAKKFLSKEKFLIMKRAIVTLNLKINSRPAIDTDFPRISDSYDKLINDLSEKTFCPNSKHTPKLAKQKEPYEKRIQNLLNEIQTIKDRNDWRDKDEKYQPYKELKEKLEDIDLKEYERTCSKHKKPNGGGDIHQCEYCNMSASSALSTLRRAYQRLDQGASKSSVENEANRLMSCPNLKRKIGAASAGTLGGINDYYNRIKIF
jgi:hypothetical protein